MDYNGVCVWEGEAIYNYCETETEDQQHLSLKRAGNDGNGAGYAKAMMH